MMNTDTNNDTPPEWKKRKGFVPSLVATGLVGLALFSTDKMSTNTVPTTAISQSAIRGFETDVVAWTGIRGTHWAAHSDPGGCAVPAFGGMEYRDDAIAVGDLRALGPLMIKTEPEGHRNCGQLYDIQCTNFAGVTGPTISAVVVSTCDVTSYGCGVDMITSTWNKVTKNADFGEASCTAELNKSSIFKNHEGMVCSFRSADNCGDCQSNAYYASVGLVNTKGKIVVSVSADGQSMRNNDNYNQFWDGGGGKGPYKGNSEFVFTFADGNTHTCLYNELQKPSNVHIW